MNGYTEHLLDGLTGDNPLAFLAAVGTLRAATQVWSGDSPRMAWRSLSGRWQPVLRVRRAWSPDELCTDLAQHLSGSLSALPNWDDVPVASQEFTALARQALHQDAASPGTLDACGWLGSEAEFNGAEEPIRVTHFKMVSGQQSFLEYIRELGRVTTDAHLRHALFETWAYADDKPSLRWDPAEDRRYALRDSNPSDTAKNPIMTVRGANRLAVEALSLFPVIPACKAPITRGFFRDESRTNYLTWPIWSDWTGIDAVRSILGHRELFSVRPRPDQLRPLGVVEVFRAERTTAYYSNFCPSRALWGTTTIRQE